MVNMLQKISRLVTKFYSVLMRESALARLLHYKRIYPTLGISSGARINFNGGRLEYAQNVNIHSDVILELPKSATIRLGSHSFIARGSLLHPASNCIIEISEYATVQERAILIGDVRIGRYTLIAPNCYVSSGRHLYDIRPEWNIRDQDAQMSESSSQHLSSNSIVIEEDCWIGINVVIMSGLRIGKGSIIGANSVVTRDIPPYSVAVGAPASVIKQRLNFLPPNAINSNTPQHLPYFYTGFRTDQQTYMHTLGQHMIGYSECHIVITVSVGAQHCYIVAQPAQITQNTDVPNNNDQFEFLHATLSVGNVTHIMSEDMAKYRFPITETEQYTLHSHPLIRMIRLRVSRRDIKYTPESPVVLVQSAWCE
jgi:acetyltransferase-like isoleucine patch superfamily enzyme